MVVAYEDIATIIIDIHQNKQGYTPFVIIEQRSVGF
jgi:hypothetical protein